MRAPQQTDEYLRMMAATFLASPSTCAARKLLGAALDMECVRLRRDVNDVLACVMIDNGWCVMEIE